MNIEHLFYSEFPAGVKYIYVNGKKISKQEFLELKKRHFKKKKSKVES
tara:strand:- start:714 stop:857 length:144 start_codon:yes stop_codon:yes gene_type:complete